MRTALAAALVLSATAAQACDHDKIKTGMTRSEVVSLCGMPVTDLPYTDSVGLHILMMYPQNYLTVYLTKRRVSGMSWLASGDASK